VWWWLLQVLQHRLQQGAAAGEGGFILDGFPRYAALMRNSL
jgi:adenylate kinase family enzyme